jgi:hypothetical protein
MFVRSADKNKDTLDPDNLATAPDLEDNGLYDFFAGYVRWVHSDDFIRKTLFKNPKTSFVDIIGPSNIAYVISIIDKDWGWESENIQVCDGNMVCYNLGSRTQSDGEEEGDSGYESDRGHGRVSLGWAKGALGEMREIEVLGEGSGDSSNDESNESNKNSDDESNESDKKRKGGRTLVFKQAEKDSPAKNTRKRMAKTAASELGKRGRGKK